MRLGSFKWLVPGALVLMALPSLARGEEAEKNWKGKCAACHGPDGTAQTVMGKKMGMGSMADAAWQKERTDDKMKEAIMKGFTRDKDGKKQEMKPFADKLKPEEVDALIAYVRKFSK
jgi:mono/diheme cytochrome c family protein